MAIQKHFREGFSMLELTLVIALILIIASVLFMTLNPSELAADARNRKRESDANVLIGLIYPNIAAGEYDIANCLIPKYTSAFPYDPKASGAHFNSAADYDLGYRVVISSTTNRVTVSAQNAESGATIQVTC